MYMYLVHLVVQYKVKTYITDFIFNMMLKGFHSHLCTIVKHRLHCQKWKWGKWMGFKHASFSICISNSLDTELSWRNNVNCKRFSLSNQ